MGLNCEVCTYNQEQPDAAAAAAAVKAHGGEEAALLAGCTPTCSRPLALSSLAPSLHWSSGGATASSPGSVRSGHGLTRANCCCRCSCSLPLRRSKG